MPGLTGKRRPAAPSSIGRARAYLDQGETPERRHAAGRSFPYRSLGSRAKGRAASFCCRAFFPLLPALPFDFFFHNSSTKVGVGATGADPRPRRSVGLLLPFFCLHRGTARSRAIRRLQRRKRLAQTVRMAQYYPQPLHRPEARQQEPLVGFGSPVQGGRDVGGAIHGEEGAAGGTNVMYLVGPPLWETMHYAAFQCPEPFAERAPALLDLVRAYAALLPCAECRGHFAALLAAHPPEEAARAGRQAFARWTVDAHNMVNARLGKPLFTFEQAAGRYARGDLCCHNSADDRHPQPSLSRRLLPAVVVAVALIAVVAAGVWLYYTRSRGAANGGPPDDRDGRSRQEESTN
nr:erv-family thiol oxidoreductase [Pandoravirus massiliensis]